MGLAVEVGALAFLLQNDPEGADWHRESLAVVNQLLAKNKLPPHREPERLPPLDNRCGLLSYPYSYLHFLRRVYAYAKENPKSWIAKPFPAGDDPAEDSVVEEQTSNFHSHLLCHSDCEGFYVPIDFHEVIFDDGDALPGGMLGSSFALRNELIAVAPALQVNVVDGNFSDAEAARINQNASAESPLWIEKIVWLSLFEAARLSILHKAAICFQ